jgi:predicted double-glycine peptidase
MHDIKREHVIGQSLDFSCGAAGISTILNHHFGDRASEKDIIASLLQITPLAKVKERKGFSLLDLKKYVEAKGYKATGYQMDIDFLKELAKPTLVPIKFKNYRHFVIVKGIIADRVFFADPAAGNMSMKVDKFNKMWTNNIGLVIDHPASSQDSETNLEISEEDLKIADYMQNKSIVTPDIIRTAIFPNEY